MRPWPGVQGQAVAGQSWDAHTCADMPGAGASTVAAPSTLQPIRGWPVPGWGCQPHILGASGKPKEGHGGQARARPFSLILNLSIPAA